MKELIDSSVGFLRVVLESKWKVAATVLLLVLALSGSLVWTERDVLIGVWLKKPAHVQVEKFAEVAPTVMEQFNATGAILMVVELEKNERSIVYFATRAKGRMKDFDGFKGQVFPASSEDGRIHALQVARLIAHETFCDASTPPVTAFGQMRLREKLIVMCRAPVLDGERLIGSVTLGFEKMPKPDSPVLDQLRILAQMVKSK